MSVTSTLNKHVYTGNGVTTTFPFTFNVFAVSDIHVYLTNPTVGTDVEITTDFLIVPNGGEYPCSSGNIVYPGYEAGTEPPADAQPDVLPDGWKITILRNIEPLQTTTYPTNSTTIRPKVIEKDFDKAIMLIQQITEALGRAFVGAVSSEANPTLPAPVAGSTLVWDSEGNLVNGTPVNGTFTNEDLQNAIDVIATVSQAVGAYKVVQRDENGDIAGDILGNSATADKINNSLTIGTTVYDGSTAQSVPYASQAEAEAGTDNDKIMTALRVGEAIAALAPEPVMPTITTGTVADGGTIPLPDGFTREQCKYVVWPHIVGGGYNAMMALECQVVQSTGVVRVKKTDTSDATSSGTAGYMCRAMI